jgi:hypothetical protein
MNTIDEDIVEATWQEVGSMEPQDAQSAMQEAAEKQPALLTYVMAATAETREEVQELGVYLYYVIFRMFEVGAEKPLEEVSIEAVERHADRNDDLLERLESAHDRFFERVSEVETARQPYIYRYLVEALFEEEDDESVELAEEETGLLFLTLKTVVDAMDEALNS